MDDMSLNIFFGQYFFDLSMSLKTCIVRIIWLTYFAVTMLSHMVKADAIKVKLNK